jgi:adenylylsulfate kinase
MGSIRTPPHDGLAVWFTGLSGAGKTTLCQALAVQLRSKSFTVQVLDGDEIRQTFSRDLGFSKEDRHENVRRLGVIAHQLVSQGTVVLIAAISPHRDVRCEVRQTIGSFLEIYVNAPLQVCIDRDPKGLYKRALAGEIACFTGISDLYEVPLDPEVQCNTNIESVCESLDKVLSAVMQRLVPTN